MPSLRNTDISSASGVASGEQLESLMRTIEGLKFSENLRQYIETFEAKNPERASAVRQFGERLQACAEVREESLVLLALMNSLLRDVQSTEAGTPSLPREMLTQPLGKASAEPAAPHSSAPTIKLKTPARTSAGSGEPDPPLGAISREYFEQALGSLENLLQGRRDGPKACERLKRGIATPYTGSKEESAVTNHKRFVHAVIYLRQFLNRSDVPLLQAASRVVLQYLKDHASEYGNPFDLPKKKA